jgi:cysteine desulfuration protein SufE
MESINNIQEEIIEEFSLFEDWMDKYEHIIGLGKELDPLDEQHKKEDNLVKGCQSQVWLVANVNEGKIEFKADSDAIITKGLVGLLVRVLSGHSPKEIMDTDLYFVNEIGLNDHLSPNRANGLAAMIKKMKTYAIAFSAMNN